MDVGLCVMENGMPQIAAIIRPIFYAHILHAEDYRIPPRSYQLNF